VSAVSTQFRRVNPHPGMMIDADVWRDAHDYHRDQLGLHHLALHGWGIIEGLEVSVVEGVENTLRIEAGYGIDPAGRFVIVPRSQNYQVTAREKQTVFLILQFRDVLADPVGSAPTRVVEAYRIQERDRLPEEPYIELGRLDFDPRAGTVKAARDAEKPGRNELDLRARPAVGSVAPTPRVMAAPGDNGSADGLAPRIDSLSEQLGSVKQQVEVLTTEVTAARQTALQPGSDDTSGGERLDSLAAQVQQLAGRLDSLGSQPGSEAPAVHEASSASPGLSYDQVASVVADQVAGLGQRLDAAARQSEALAQQIGTAQQREEADVQGLGVRLDDLRREIDSLGLQLQAVSRQVDAQPAARTVVTAVPVPAASQPVQADRPVLRMAPGEHNTPGWDAHRDGLRYLAREISAATDVTSQVGDPVRVRDASGVQLLYLSGHGALGLDDAEVDAIGRLLNDGAVVIGEGCATGPSGEAGAREFAMSFVDLANRLGRQLARVDRGHPLMVARHVFGELPSGARPTPRVLESSGMVYSDADYGCAWQGGPAEHPLARGVIRDALEFGTNLAVFRRNGGHG
jgi:Domain of unknown function (DUF4159)